MTGAAVRLGKMGTALLVLLIAGLVFIGGSALFDSVVNRNPPHNQVVETVLSQVPIALRRFAFSGLHTSPSDSKSNVRTAKVPNPTFRRLSRWLP